MLAKLNSRTLYKPEELLDGSLLNRVRLYRAAIAGLPPKADWRDQAAESARLKQTFGLTYEDILAADFDTAAVMPDLPISERCGQTEICPIHRTEYTIVTGNPTRDCGACEEEMYKRERHAQASSLARQAALERSGVEEPVATFAQQRAQDLRTARLLVAAPLLTVIGLTAFALLYAFVGRHGG